MMGVDYEMLPFWNRPDLTPYLIHLTKGGNGRTAFDNLLHILEDKQIYGSSKRGFIKDSTPATCFMDVPFYALKDILTKKNNKRYAPYGIFITKKYAYRNGIRPVLYLSNPEKDALHLPQEELWRVVRLEIDSKSKWICWLQEREWRKKGNFKLPNNVGVLVKKNSEIRLLQEKLAELSCKKIQPRAILPLNTICQGLEV